MARLAYPAEILSPRRRSVLEGEPASIGLPLAVAFGAACVLACKARSCAFHGRGDRMSSDFDFMTAREMARRIARREISPVDVTRRALAKAEATQQTLNSFFLIMDEQALAAARAAEA